MIGLFLFVLVFSASAEEIRLAHGPVVQGELIQVNDDGLEIKTPQGNKTLTWKTLSRGTRFRHQPGYRENYDRILRGEITQPADS